MRRVPLKVVDILDGVGRENKLVYVELFEQLAKLSETGLTAAEMDIPLAVAGSLQTARRTKANSVMLEEAEWVYLCGRVKNHKWPFASKDFQQMVADVEGAEKVDPNAKAMSAAD